MHSPVSFFFTQSDVTRMFLRCEARVYAPAPVLHSAPASTQSTPHTLPACGTHGPFGVSPAVDDVLTHASGTRTSVSTSPGQLPGSGIIRSKSFNHVLVGIAMSYFPERAQQSRFPAEDEEEPVLLRTSHGGFDFVIVC